MRFDDGIFGLSSQFYENRREVELALEVCLRERSDDPPIVHARQKPHLARILLKLTYDVDHDFDLLELVQRIESIVAFLRNATEQFEKSKQIVDLLTPVLSPSASSPANTTTEIRQTTPPVTANPGITNHTRARELHTIIKTKDSLRRKLEKQLDEGSLDMARYIQLATPIEEELHVAQSELDELQDNRGGAI
jgi:hypothetical protein